METSKRVRAKWDEEKKKNNAMEVVANGLKFEDERVSMHSRELHPQNNANKQNANKKNKNNATRLQYGVIPIRNKKCSIISKWNICDECASASEPAHGT